MSVNKSLLFLAMATGHCNIKLNKERTKVEALKPRVRVSAILGEPTPTP